MDGDVNTDRDVDMDLDGDTDADTDSDVESHIQSLRRCEWESGLRDSRGSSGMCW